MDKFNNILELFLEADEELEEPTEAPEMKEEEPVEDTETKDDAENDNEEEPVEDTETKDDTENDNEEEETVEDTETKDGEDNNEEESVEDDVNIVEMKNKETIFKLFKSSSILISDIKDNIKNIKETKINILPNNEKKNELNKIILFTYNELDETNLIIEDILLNRIEKLEYDILKQIYMKIIGKIEFIVKLFEQINNIQ